MMKIIADFAEDLNSDPEFVAAMEAANIEAINAAVKDGFVSREMPQDTMETFLDNPENFEALKTRLIKQIVESPNAAKTEGKKQTLMQRVFTQGYIESHIIELAPEVMRRGEIFNKFKYAIIKGVLTRFILQFPLFEEKFKDDIDLYTAYKDKMLNLNVARLMLEYQGKPEFDRIFDQRLLQDPDFQRKLEVLKENVDPKKYRGIVQTNPSNYLKLDEQIKAIPEVQEAYERVVIAGLKVMFSKESHKLMLDELQKEGPMGQKLGMGIAGLMLLLIKESNGTIPPEVIIPAGINLLTRAADFIRKSKIDKITNGDIGDAMEVFISTILEKFGVDPAKMADMLNQYSNENIPSEMGA
jgi:hypothetical protein